MTAQNKELQEARKYIDEWNKRREAAEKKGLEKFYKLKELFKNSKNTTMKTLKFLSLLTIVLVTTNANGQSKKLIHEYKQKPVTDTAYHYIEKHLTNSDGKVFLWVQDLQTGERFEVSTECLPKDSIPPEGTIKRTLRSKIIIEPKKREL